MRRRIVIVGAALVLAVGVGAVSWRVSGPGLPRYNVPNRFAATTGSFAFLRGLDGGRELVIYDVAARRAVVLRASHGEFWMISPSRRADAYYVSHAVRPTVTEVRDGTQPTATLLICDAQAGCRPLLAQKGAIGSVAEWEGDRLFFVGSAWSLYADGPNIQPWTVANSRSDLFATDQSGPPQRLTKWEVPGLGNQSVAGSRLVFQASPQRRYKRGQTLYGSEIYAADLYGDGRISGFDPATSEPAVSYGDNFDTRPSLSSDGTMVAFISAVSDLERKGYRYDVVVVAAETAGKLVASVRPPPGAELSRPVFVGTTKVRYLIADGSTYRFQELDTVSGEAASLADVPIDEIARAVSRTVDLALTP